MQKRKPENIITIILAAGSSKRMGAIKQLLPWGNTTLAGHAIEQALNSEASEVYVVLGAHYEQIKKEIGNFPVTIIKNENWESGMGTSISVAVNYILNNNIHAGGLLITLSDQPLINYTHLNSLIETFKKGQYNCISAVQYGGKHGVPAIFPKTYFKLLSTLDQDFGARNILNSSIPVLSTSFDQINIDLDTDKEYREAYSEHHS